MEMRCEIKIYEYDIKTGNYNNFAAAVLHKDINTSAKQMFDEVIKNNDKIFNKFFVMEIESVVEEPFKDSIDFYTVKTNEKGDIDEINMVGPNNLNRDVLIDAIMGCKPTKSFYSKYKDRVIDKIVEKQNDEEFRWADDAKDRLKKFNVIRLREIYKKLRANQ